MLKRWWVLGLILMCGCQKSVVEEINSKPEHLDPRVTPISMRKYTNISMDEELFVVEVVDTPERISLGLSYRDEIGAEGMLFYLGNQMIPSFWMKGMKFGLDFVWLECENSSARANTSEGTSCEVVDVTERVPPPKNPDLVGGLPTYSPKSPVTHVLEVNEGWVDTKEVSLGTTIAIK